VIGNLGTLLGDHQINISRLQLGREKAGGRAISMFGIDAAVSQDLLAKIKKLPNILSVRQIKL
jgi:D-3-phosphoglycerate dehydrogenase